jgi:hypothetical protein
VWNESPLLGTVIVVAFSIVSVFVAIFAFKTAMTMFTYLLSNGLNMSQSSPATTWSIQPSPAIITPESVLAISHTAAAPSSTLAITKGLTKLDSPSDLTELISSKSLRAVNKSDHFQVHVIGDSHIVVKAPWGFKAKNKSSPFTVIVLRGDQVLDSTLSKVFDGIYTVSVDHEEAYGPLNVTIRRHKSSHVEGHEIDFGAQWLKVEEDCTTSFRASPQ